MASLELLGAVRETHPDRPFILCPGKGSEEIVNRAISAGVTDSLHTAVTVRHWPRRRKSSSRVSKRSSRASGRCRIAGNRRRRATRTRRRAHVRTELRPRHASGRRGEPPVVSRRDRRRGVTVRRPLHPRRRRRRPDPPPTPEATRRRRTARRPEGRGGDRRRGHRVRSPPERQRASTGGS